MDSSLTSKSGSSGVSPMTQRKTPFAVASIRVLILSMCAALLLSIGSQRLKALPAGSDIAGRRAHFDQIWASCGGDSACCATHFSPPARPHRVVRAAVRTADKHQVRWRMALHAKSSDGADIVSEMIFFHLSWEANKTRNILTALNRDAAPGTLLDIGANIGWCTLAAAYYGTRVVAVEPFSENIALLSHSLCLAPPEVRNRVTLLPTGLGTKDDMRCEMWAWPGSNRGNTHTVCDNAASAAWMAKQGYKKLDEVPLTRLDSLIARGDIAFGDGEKVAVKIDVEGFEYLALRGAEGFLDKVLPAVVWAEYIPKMIERAAESVGLSSDATNGSPSGFLEFMKEKGYSQKMVPLGKPHKVWGQSYEAVFRRKS